MGSRDGAVVRALASVLGEVNTRENVAAQHSFSSVTSLFLPINSVAGTKFVPTACCMKFSWFVFVQHVARTN